MNKGGRQVREVRQALAGKGSQASIGGGMMCMRDVAPAPPWPRCVQICLPESDTAVDLIPHDTTLWFTQYVLDMLTGTCMKTNMQSSPPAQSMLVWFARLRLC